MDISELISIWRAEKGNNSLTALPNDFYSSALAFLESVRQNSFEYDKAEDIYNGITGIRQHKMLMAVLRELDGKDRLENMNTSEAETYIIILNALRSLKTGKESSETVCLTREEGINETPEGQEILGEQTQETEAKEPEKPNENEEPPEKEDNENNHCIEHEGVETGQDLEDLNKVFPSDEASHPDQPDAEVLETKTDDPTGNESTEPEKEDDVFKQGAENKGDVIRVRFLKPMPAFVGPDLETLGPFEEEQVLEIAKEIAEILLKNDAVEEA